MTTIQSIFYWIGVIVTTGGAFYGLLWATINAWWYLKDDWWPTSKINQLRCVLIWWYHYDYKDKSMPYTLERMTITRDRLLTGNLNHTICKVYVIELLNKQIKRKEAELQSEESNQLS